MWIKHLRYFILYIWYIIGVVIEILKHVYVNVLVKKKKKKKKIHKTFTIELNNSYKIVYNLLDDYYKFVGRRDSMITVYKHIEEELVSDSTVSDATKGSWVNLVNPDPDELSLINILTEIPTDVLKTALDMEERSHVELEDNYIFIVINIPVIRGKRYV